MIFVFANFILAFSLLITIRSAAVEGSALEGQLMKTNLRRTGIVNGLVFLGCLFAAPQAFGRGDRVLGSGEEGASLRVSYVRKMEKIDSDKKQCRKDIETIIAPEIALLDQFGQAGHAGPALHQKEEAQLVAEGEKLAKLQTELVQLGRTLNRQGRSGSEENAKLVRLFEKRLKEYVLIEKGIVSRSDSLIKKSDRLVSHFVPFAKAVLSIKKTEACEQIWLDLRSSIPKNMEALVTKNKNRVRQIAASARNPSSTQNFTALASQMLFRFKTKSQVAFDENVIE